MICGAGIELLPFEVTRVESIATPYGVMSAELQWLEVAGKPLLALRRHGADHQIPPHQINFRANVWGLRECGVSHCLAVHAVGSLDPEFAPGTLRLPAQLIDYTYGREHTYSDGTRQLDHVEFEPPFSEELIQNLQVAAEQAGVNVPAGGVYGVTQGPRLETAAEIDRMERDGCTMVGMTAMPEAGLARELAMPYASCAVAVNWAAGRGPAGVGIHGQIARHAEAGFGTLRKLLEQWVTGI